jgi:peptide/nickel transport system substrate-binding protein
VKAVVLALALVGGWWASAAVAAERPFVYHLNAPPENLDPAKCNNVRCQRVMWPIYEPLVNLSKDVRTIVPGLASSWEVGPGGLTYTFRLRRGVTFHDGAPFNATAAKLNLERHFLPGSPFYTASPRNVRETLLAGLIREIVVQDEYTLGVTLKGPKVHFLSLVPMVSPEALARHGAKVGEHPVGTGPFKFARWSADEIHLTANPDYWGGRPKLAGITFKVVPQSEKMTQDFLAGRIDFIPEIEPIHVERIVSNRSTKLLRVPTLSVYYLGFRTDRKPFDDLRVRQAVTKALDVERAVLFTSRGTAVPAYGPVPPGADFYDTGLKTSRLQPDVAGRLLREAGYGNGLRASMLFNAGWGFFGELAQAFKADLAKVGVTVDLLPAPGYRELVADVRQGRADLFIYAWLSLFTDPEIFLAPLFQTGSVDNLTLYGNPKVDALLEQARGPALEPAARIDLYRRAQRTIVEDAPMVFLFHEVRVSGYNTRVGGLELNVHSLPIDRFARVELRPE